MVSALHDGNEKTSILNPAFHASYMTAQSSSLHVPQALPSGVRFYLPDQYDPMSQQTGSHSLAECNIHKSSYRQNINPYEQYPQYHPQYTEIENKRHLRAYEQPSEYRQPGEEPQFSDAFVSSQSRTPQYQNIHSTEGNHTYI